MKAIIEPGNIHGTINCPPSKSMTQRAYAAALLRHGRTIIKNAGSSEDERAALEIIQQLGARVISTVDVAHFGCVPHLVEIESNGVHPIADTILCGESGLSARLFAPIAALSKQAIKIDGTGSLLRRPMTGIEEVFAQLNVSLTGFNGYIPFTIKGPIVPTAIKMDAGDSSQLLSGLLFALSSCATEPVTIEVANLNSKPYIDLTIDVLKYFGRNITHNNYKEFYIDPATFTNLENVKINIEGDWSSAAYLLVAGAIAGEVTIKNLDAASKQADVAILTVLKDAGATVAIHGDGVTVRREALRAFEFDATQCPDLFPVLSILAACCEGESYIAGVHRLFYKESNRAESISEMLQNFDVPFSISDDTLCITGVKKLQGTVIDSFNDHRMAMAATIGALRAGGQVDILHAQVVNKSYPGFWGDLILCGGKCTFVEH